jgi:predicted ATPase with chaperone activity
MLVEVGVDIGQGQPGMVVVGLPDAAIRNSGGRFPHGKVTVKPPATSHHTQR